MRTMFACVVVVLVASSASAQSIDKWQMRIYNTGAVLPLQAPADLLLANVQCGLPAPIAGSTVNPNIAGWDDPTPGPIIGQVRFCRWDDPGTGVLNALPFGAASYQATLQAWASTLAGPESARASFTRPGATPAAPTGFKVVR
jgi:hypothetical protein